MFSQLVKQNVLTELVWFVASMRVLLTYSSVIAICNLLCVALDMIQWNLSCSFKLISTYCRWFSSIVSSLYCLLFLELALFFSNVFGEHIWSFEGESARVKSVHFLDLTWTVSIFSRVPRTVHASILGTHMHFNHEICSNRQ